MCFSEKVSIATFALGFGFGLLITLLPKPEDKVIGFFLAFVSLMQGIEALLWRHQDCDLYNRMLTSAGMWLNHLQPLLLIGLSSAYFPKTLNILFPIGILYSIAMILYTMQFDEASPDGKCTRKDTCTPHLHWKWNELENYRLFYAFFMLVLFSIPFLVFQDTTIAKFISFAGVISWSVSATIYPPHVVGALWCFFTAFLPIVYFSFRIAKLL